MKNLRREKVWDPVTRLWHWVLVVAVVTNWIFGEFMSFDTVQWHFYIGYLVLGLMGFRILWGLVGPAQARFASFLPTPSSALAYLRTMPRREPSGIPGHNPLGALSVLAMLITLTAQGFTGLFIEADDFFEYAPLNDAVSEETVKFMSGWHHFLAEVILVLVVLHVAAIIFYLVWKRENLIRPMISGWKWVRGSGQE